MHYWEWFFFLNVLPLRVHVFDDEAMHSDSIQMVHLRYLIAECGLMVIHPMDIVAALKPIASNPLISGISTIYLHSMLLRKDPLIDGDRGKESHYFPSRWDFNYINAFYLNNSLQTSIFQAKSRNLNISLQNSTFQANGRNVDISNNRSKCRG